MANNSDVRDLQKEIFRLASDNLNLVEEKSSPTERIVEVPPPDYQSLKEKSRLDDEQIAELQKHCKTLEHILAYCEISPLTKIIMEYKSMSNFYLLQLVKEAEIYRASATERSELINFVEYLHGVTKELEELLMIEH